MSNEEQHKNVIAGKDNSIKIKGGLEVEGDLTIKGESAGVGGGGSFSEEEMRRLLAAGNVTAPPPEWISSNETFDHIEGHINTAANDLAQLLTEDGRNYRSFVIGGHFSYEILGHMNAGGNYYAIEGISGNNPSLTDVKTGDTYIFTSGPSHPLEIVNSDGDVVATESDRVTTFTPTATGTYTYRCQTHPSDMLGSIVVGQGGNTFFEIVGSTRSASNNPGSLDKDDHPEVFSLRFIAAPDANDGGDAGTHNHCRITAIGLLGVPAVKVCTFNILDLEADDAPSWADAPSSFTVAERDASGNQPVTLLQHRLLAKRKKANLDADGNVIDSYPAEFTHPDRYEIVDGGTAYFELVSGTFAGAASPQVVHGPDSGQALTDILKFKDTHPPDYEGTPNQYYTNQSFSLTIRAWNHYVIGTEDTAKYSDHTFTINITDSAWDNAPLWQTAPIEIDITEGNDTRSSNSGAANNNSINGPLNLRKYLQTVTLSAQTGNVLNDPSGNTANPNAQEYTFSIIDSDISGGTLLGSSSAGSNAASAWFSIANGGSGQTGSPWLTFHSDKVDGDGIDWESTHLAWNGNAGQMHWDQSNSFYFTVRANNPLEGKTADKIIRVIVSNDHTDDAPAWLHGGSTGQTASSASPAQVPEPQTGASFTWGLDLSDLIHGSQRSTTTFTIDSSYNDGAKFTITDGNLKFITAPDFENPVDVGGNNLYLVKLTATNSKGVGAGDSGGRSSQQVVYIEVTDREADNTAHWPSNVGTTHTIDEYVAEGEEVFTIPGGGQYVNDYVITYVPEIADNGEPFILDGLVVKTKGEIDLTNEQDTTFNLIIAARNLDGAQGDTKTFAITVANVLTDEFDMDNPFEFTVEP